ncbi:MAG: GNAT family N-acetyltransferase [Ruminococcaceae bacterium]|nr:GNAT family N-acetyltransferase [Oscillospiraceae bacterium]
MKIDIEKFVFKECSKEQLDDILRIQEETFKNLEASELLRKNTPEMLLECLQPPHITLGAWYEGELAAFSVLYYPHTKEESLCDYLDNVDCLGLKDANYKLCIVKEKFRGNSLQYELEVRLEKYAVEAGVKILCATASPHNIHSIKNIEKMGYSYNKTLNKYGLVRNLYYKFI